MKVFGLGFPELAITSAVFAIPLVIGVLLIVPWHKGASEIPPQHRPTTIAS